MARLLALDWDQQQLQIVAAATGSRLRIQHAAVWTDFPPPTPGEAEASGKRFAERLKAAGIAPGNVVACLGRERVILKDIRHPAASPADEPGLVRFQTAKELTDPVEDVVIDYTPLEEPAANGERHVAALVIKKEVIEACHTFCRAAGLKLIALTPRPYGTLACYTALAAKGLAPVQAEQDAVGVLTTTDKSLEFCVLRGRSVLFSRALTAGIGPGLVGELRRNLAVYSGQWPQYPLKAVVLAGGEEQAQLREQLQALPVPVHLLDPFGAADRDNLPSTGPGRYMSALGLLYSESSRASLAINFACPKQPVFEKDPNQRRNILVAAAAAVLVLGLGFLGWMQLSERDQQIQDLALEKVELDKTFNALQQDARKIKGLSEWTKTQVNWLDELYDMTARIPDPDALRLTEFSASVGDPHAKTALDKSARLTIKGVTGREAKALDTLRTQLTSEEVIHHVGPSNLSINRTVDTQRFSQSFTTSMHVDARSPAKYVRQLKALEEGQPQRGGRNPRGRFNGADLGQEGGRP